MKTPEEIKRGLNECTKFVGCEACPYLSYHKVARCTRKLAADALAYIRQLEAELAQVKAERDRYWEYIKGLGCDTCGGDCDRCEVGLDRVWSGWVWAGEKEEERE